MGHGAQAADPGALTSEHSCLSFTLVSIQERPSARWEARAGPRVPLSRVVSSLVFTPPRVLSLLGHHQPTALAGPGSAWEAPLGWSLDLDAWVSRPKAILAAVLVTLVGGVM